MAEGAEEGIGSYRRIRSRKVLAIGATTLILILLLLLSLYIGKTPLTLGQILGNIWGQDGTWEGYVVHDIHLKRSVAAIIAGVGLGVSGAAMQCVLRNPLGSPYTLGLSNAAAFGAALGIMVIGGGSIVGSATSSYMIDNPYIVVISAFFFSMIATCAIVMAMRMMSASPETMVLAGMAMSAIFSAGIAFLQYQADESTLSAMVFWQFGDLEKIGWSNMPIMAVVVLFASLFLYSRSWDLNAIDMGDDVASGLGINVSLTRIAVLVAAALMTSVIISFVGIIGFIGLLAPHLARRVVEDDKRLLFPASAAIGATVMLAAMLIGQNAFSFVVPVGIITSLVGGPLFLWILFSKYRGRTVGA